MAKVKMTIILETISEGGHIDTDGLHTALWVAAGGLLFDGKIISAGEGLYLNSFINDRPSAVPGSKLVRFVVDPDEDTGITSANRRVLMERILGPLPGDQFLRLDQVSFPPGARAYRHVHPGPGIRYLTKGSLEIRSDHGVENIAMGEAWFEDANSPVLAVAASDQPTAFVRAMILPLQFLGKPSISYLDSSDDDKPKLQTNKRFFDQPIEI